MKQSKYSPNPNIRIKDPSQNYKSNTEEDQKPRTNKFKGLANIRASKDDHKASSAQRLFSPKSGNLGVKNKNQQSAQSLNRKTADRKSLREEPPTFLKGISSQINLGKINYMNEKQGNLHEVIVEQTIQEENDVANSQVKSTREQK